MQTGRLSVHTENILPIIKKWLYSEKEIFLRELVSNAFDAISKLKKVRLQEDIRDAEDEAYAVDIRIDREKNVLTIEDNGVGMDADEIQRYITQIAFSGAEDFARRYEESKDKSKAGIIGNFGLGFYSSFMVADRVEIDSLSWNPSATAAFWSSDGGEEYQIGEGTRTKRGTTIRLFMEEGSRDLLDLAEISRLLRRYCDFLPVPIKVDGAQVNREHALWTKQPSQVKPEEYTDLYKHLYPYQGDPLFYVHLNVDYPFQLQGILFFPRLAHEMDLNRSDVKIFCKQVFVTDEAQELIPRFLTVLQGVIDLPDLPLNVSRSYLQNEPQVRKIAQHIIKKVADRLNEEFRNNRDHFEEIWPEISPFVKYAMMNDERFYEQARESLVFELTKAPAEGSRFTTIEDYQARNKDRTDKRIYYVSDNRSQAGPLKLLESQGIEVLRMGHLIDSHFMQFLESKAGGEFHFARVDAEISEHVLDKSADAKLVDSEGKDLSDQVTELFKSTLNDDQITLRVEALKDESIPAMVLLPEQMRRFSEMSAMLQQGSGLQFPKQHTLILNSRNEIIKGLAKPAIITGETGPGKRELIAREVYLLARFAVGGVGPDEFEDFLKNSYQVLERAL
ncbi:MAG: molecular chaperone HtpG [Spirochaetales bacterium]|nr:molecular chaperone HtpG [Leptospiraceae bacterium]MCP5481679.1 molecular chaperone HtpG [Spirochaetales bacterium]